MPTRRPPRPAVDNGRVLVASDHYLLAATEALAKVDPDKLDPPGLLAYAQTCALVAVAGRVDELPEQIGHTLR
ncbi:hypothetical protein [Parafrankia sp. FMc2]|uniref:hypothetical protein n=1 Tax=Parafrankia sp. FMc2 TaxID=3233196 RepID=UPI0034D5268F